ncbi:MAG: hypothetical protein CVU48_08530 [Candidatus Cloacimonetes bacterium HGW-Cloacimonetes-1]|jgi:hypothetical protein|nr:MAG: hypothetical protein CVU48_08530 [Candidatus Cloacimonetes bacterium HGW-Cloacimonetes-1]
MKRTLILCIILLAVLYANPAFAVTVEAVKPAIYSGTGLPKLSQMTRLSGNLHKQIKPGYLRIAADYFCYSDDRFYTAIQTSRGSFPGSGKLGTAWYSYMTIIGKPGNDDIVWALAYINVPMAKLRPGLYRIDKRKKHDLVRIGDIEFHVDKENSLLRMSCKISDLLADPDFAAWYNKDTPRFGLLSITSSTTILPMKTTTVDSTYPGRLIIPGK